MRCSCTASEGQKLRPGVLLDIRRRASMPALGWETLTQPAAAHSALNRLRPGPGSRLQKVAGSRSRPSFTLHKGSVAPREEGLNLGRGEGDEKSDSVRFNFSH